RSSNTVLLTPLGPCGATESRPRTPGAKVTLCYLLEGRAAPLPPLRSADGRRRRALGRPPPGRGGRARRRGARAGGAARAAAGRAAPEAARRARGPGHHRAVRAPGRGVGRGGARRA